MKNVLAVLAMATAAAASQVPPVSQATPAQPAAGQARPQVPPSKPRPQTLAAPAVPAVKDLKFPPLRAIEIPHVETVTLPNGMKLFLLEDHELPLISGAARVRTGNLFDPPDKVGLATITGMVMRTGGTKAKTGDQLDLQLEDIAASVESNIGETAGSVSFSALKENADEVLGVFKDVITAPEFRQDKLDLAKTQLASGISRRNDSPQEIVRREFTSTLYGKSTPYGWDIEYATLDHIARGDLQQFYRRYFFPKNVMLAVWGDFDAAQMRAKVEKLFADWTVEQPPVPEFPKVDAKPVPGTYLAAKQDVTQTFFSIGHLGGELKDKDYPALEIMADILGGGFQSRLVARIRTKMGNAYQIGADWGANYDHPGLFEISGSTKSYSTVETIKAVEEEVERIRTTEVTEEELKTAKDTALNSLVFLYDTRTKTLGRMLSYEYYGYPKDFIQQYQKALAAVTRADVLRVAKEHLKPADFVLVTVGNPQDFRLPLENLGSPVYPIDLTIPSPTKEAAAADPASLEKGKQILARAQQAAGGAGKLAAVKDCTQVAEFQVTAPGGGGMSVNETDRWIAPNYFRQDSVIPSGKIAAYSDGKTGWIATPQGWGPLGGAQLKQVQGDLFRLYVRMLLSDRIQGRAANAIDDLTVEISDPDGNIVQASFAAETGLLTKVRYEAATAAGPPVSVEDTFSDFRAVDGIMMPFKFTIVQGGNKFADVTVTDYRLNTGLKLEELEKRP